ncbi:hypothetical protein NHX12_002379 [Muraenolepis orangiensis]|uniref:Corticotropin-releasing factor domain-containing protein n=1 Tax=Muraenolepis orangiensis TaxID=630683 RepID=A0A9Q0DZD8_9TELE|nr:hypothetical protein NHX12_002379 [Muraenolepis orangiensis]
MKLFVLLCAVALSSESGTRPSDQLHRPPLPVLLRLGERSAVRLHDSSPDPAGPRSDPRSYGPPPPAAATANRVLRLQRRARRKVAEKEKISLDPLTSLDPPISLDLTFHLLREVLEMARVEQLAQQADDNRRMMDTFGK